MRGLSALVAVVLASVSLAACGAGHDHVGDRPLRVVMADDWADTEVVLDVIRAFEATYDVRVDVSGPPFHQIPEEAADAAASGLPFDVIHHHAFAAGPAGLAEPLTDLWADGTFSAADHFPGAVEDVTWGDTRYGVPLDVNAMLMIHAADAPAPRSFADIRAQAEAAVAAGRRGMTVSASSWEAYGWVRANGGELVDVAADGTPTLTLDAPRVVEALDFLAGLIRDGLAYGPVSRGVSSDAFELFGDAETQLLASGTWSIAALEEAFPDRRHAAAPMPRGPAVAEEAVAGTALGGSSLFVGRGSEQEGLAVAFIQALTADDVAVRLALEEGRFPPRPALYEQLGSAPAADALSTQLPTASPMKLIAFPGAQAAFDMALDEILTGRASAADALARAQAVAQEAVESS